MWIVKNRKEAKKAHKFLVEHILYNDHSVETDQLNNIVTIECSCGKKQMIVMKQIT